MMKHGDLNKFIKYDTKVTNVTFDEEKKTFLVQTTSADNIGAPHQGREALIVRFQAIQMALKAVLMKRQVP
jgi:hypothetical protein